MRILLLIFILFATSPAWAQDSYSSLTQPGAGVTAFTSPNIAMPNGGNIGHLIYQSRPGGGSTVISGTSATTVFSATGDGSLTVPSASMFLGARFRVMGGGIGQTGGLNVSTVAGCLKLGSVSLICNTTAALPASLAAIPFRFEVVCTVKSIGASGTMSCRGGLFYATGLSSASVFATDLTSTSAVTIDTTVSQTWDATVQLSSGIGSPSLTVYDACIIQEN